MSKIFEIKNYEDVHPFGRAEIFYSFIIAVVFVASIVLMVNLFLSSTFYGEDGRCVKINAVQLKP